MKNTTPILVLTGLAIVAAVGIAGLTREQWMGQKTTAVATPDTISPPAAEAPAPSAETAAPAAPAAPEQPASAEKPAAPEASASSQTAALEPAAPEAEKPATPEASSAPEAPATPATTPEPAAEQPATQPEQSAAVQPAQPEAEPAPNAAAEPAVPAFDTVRIEKTGEALIAGRAEAGSEVVVKLNGQEIGKTVANSDGAFVVVPEKPLPSGSGAITIEAKGKGDLQPVASQESVAVIVPAGQAQEALVAVVSPDAPTKVLQKPGAPAEKPEPAAPAAEEQPEPAQPAAETPAKLVSIDAVDYDASGNIVFSGQGEKGNTARIYVDNSFLGDAQVGEDGRWTFSGTADVAQGVHTLRVDGLDAKGNVLNRVEVPFFREDQTKVADATQPAPAPEQPAEEQPVAEQPAAEQPVAEQPAAVALPAEQQETTSGAPAAEAEAPAAAPAQQQPETAEQPPASQAAEAPAADQQQETAQKAEETVAAAAASGSAGEARPKEGRIVIQPGNNLWRISRVLYGSGNKFTMLYEANKDQIRNPNLIYPGQVFKTPQVAPRSETIDPKRREPLKPDENAATAE